MSTEWSPVSFNLWGPEPPELESQLEAREGKESTGTSQKEASSSWDFLGLGFFLVTAGTFLSHEVGSQHTGPKSKSNSGSTGHNLYGKGRKGVPWWPHGDFHQLECCSKNCVVFGREGSSPLRSQPSNCRNSGSSPKLLKTNLHLNKIITESLAFKKEKYRSSLNC